MADAWKNYHLNDAKFNSEVEIIIPFHGKHKLVTSLIENIWRTVNTPYQITLMDDGSENEEFISQLHEGKLPQIVCMRHDKQEGLGASLNSVLQNPSKPTPWVVFVQPETIPDGNWLQQLGNSMQGFKTKGVKMVAPRCNNPGGNVKGSQKAEFSDDFILPDDAYLTFYCVLCHRELFSKIGMFKEIEDPTKEFSDRLKRHGFLQGIAGKAWVSLTEDFSRK